MRGLDTGIEAIRALEADMVLTLIESRELGELGVSDLPGKICAAFEWHHLQIRDLKAPRDGRAETVENLGAGWITEEALSIALYACLCARDLEHGPTIAVTHSGDSDSNAAIAGKFWGLCSPIRCPSTLGPGQVECRDLIEQVASDLTTCSRGRVGKLMNPYEGW